MQTPHKERVQTGRPPTIETPGGPGVRRRSFWFSVIAALVIGGLIGYLLGWWLAPTETTTVTKTVTEAPPAYTASTDVQAQVTFDGKRCLFSGPAEVSAGTQATFDYAATVPASALTVWLLAEGTTYEQVAKAVSQRAADNPPPFLVDYQQSSPLDARQQTLTMPLGEGTWVVSCATSPDTSSNEVFLATMLRVVPS